MHCHCAFVSTEGEDDSCLFAICEWYFAESDVSTELSVGNSVSAHTHIGFPVCNGCFSSLLWVSNKLVSSSVGCNCGHLG